MFENEGDFCVDRERCFPVQAEVKSRLVKPTAVFVRQKSQQQCLEVPEMSE